MPMNNYQMTNKKTSRLNHREVFLYLNGRVNFRHSPFVIRYSLFISLPVG